MLVPLACGDCIAHISTEQPVYAPSGLTMIMLIICMTIMQERSKALEVQLLEQKAREASLQLQVAALCAELTRAADVTGERGVHVAWLGSFE